MDIILLIKLGLSLLAVLAVLVFFLVAPKKEKKKPKTKKPTPPKQDTDLKTLIKIIKDKSIDVQTLASTADAILKYHGMIPQKLGIRTHPDYTIYDDIIFTICRHPKTTSNIVLDFTTGLEKKNQEYKQQINDSLSKGLNSRSIR